MGTIYGGDGPFTDKGKLLEQYAPKGDDAYLLPAWLGCLRWAMTTPEIMRRFEAKTGLKWMPGRSPIERMVDEACGVQDEFFDAFAKWMNDNLWGEV